MKVPATAKGEATRAHLLRTAAEAFAEKGYAGTTQNDLIAASGLTKGAFYFYFPSKLDLALAVIVDQKSRFLVQVEQLTRREPTATAQLRVILPAMLELMASEPGAWSVARLSRELSADSEAMARIGQPLGEWIDFLAAIIRRGQDEGEMRADVDAAAVAAVLVAAFDGLKSLADPADSPEAANQLFGQRTHTLLTLVESALTPR